MTSTATSMQPAKLLTPRMYFAGLVIVCTVALVWALSVQLKGGLFLGKLGLFQQVSYIALIMLGSVGILVGGAVRRGRLVQVIGGLCVLALFANFAFACLQVGGDMGWWSGPVAMLRESSTAPFSEATWSLLGLSLAGWNGTIVLVLGVVSLATLMRPPDKSTDIEWLAGDGRPS